MIALPWFNTSTSLAASGYCAGKLFMNTAGAKIDPWAVSFSYWDYFCWSLAVQEIEMWAKQMKTVCLEKCCTGVRHWCSFLHSFSCHKELPQQVLKHTWHQTPFLTQPQRSVLSWAGFEPVTFHLLSECTHHLTMRPRRSMPSILV